MFNSASRIHEAGMKSCTLSCFCCGDEVLALRYKLGFKKWRAAKLDVLMLVFAVKGCHNQVHRESC